MISKLFKQIYRFLIIGGISTIINYLIFFALFKFLVINYLSAAVMGYVVGLMFGYIFNTMWTFESTKHKKTHEFAKYLLVYICSLILSMILLQILVESLHLTAIIANIFAIILSTSTNFIGCKIFVFKKIINS